MNTSTLNSYSNSATRCFLLICLLFFFINGVTSIAPLRVGMVKDNMLKDAASDLAIYQGVAWWSQWITAQGGLKYLL